MESMIDVAAEQAYGTPFTNSSLLVPLLMSLVGDRNSPITSTSFETSYDYIVVGGGSSGSVVASRLSELDCVSVLLLEAGDKPPLLNDVPVIQGYFLNSKLDWKYKTQPQSYTGSALPNRQVKTPSGFGLGGSTLLNALFYVRGNMQDYDDWEAGGATGWSYDDVLPYFKKSEDNLNPEYVANGYHGVGGLLQVEKPKSNSNIKVAAVETARSMGYSVGDVNGPRQTGFYDYQGTTRLGQRCNSAKAFLVPAENRTNLDIVTNAYVTKIMLKGKTATGVVVDIDGETYEIKAKREVVMTAGAIKTSQLLMLSGIGPKKELGSMKIPCVADLPVGENLQDHACLTVEFAMDESKVEPIDVKIEDEDNIQQYIDKKTGILTLDAACDLQGFINSESKSPLVDSPDYELHLGEITPTAVAALYGLEGKYLEYYEEYNGMPIFICFSNVLQGKSRGTVKLQSKDPYDDPLIDPNYFSDPYDLDITVKGMEMCQRIGTSAPFKKLGATPLSTPFPGCEDFKINSREYFQCRAESMVNSLSHVCGTAKMGSKNDPTTVVDPQLRVKGINHLRIADASVMPVIPKANINAAVTMVAEKASDMIKQSIQC